MTRTIDAPSASGTQPPSRILSALAPRKTRSIASSGSMRASACHSGQRQTFQMTKIAIIAVTTIVPVTAMP